MRALRASLAAGAVLALLAGCGSTEVLAAPGSSPTQTTTPAQTTTPTPTVTPTASATRPLSAAWSALPQAPIVARSGAVVVDGGRELIVWGGSADRDNAELLADGAAYDPASGTWRKLPPAPLSARTQASAGWTGTQLIVWGGYDGQQSVAADGAAYDPATNAWAMLPAAPLAARAGALATWTGNRMVLLGGQPAVITTTTRSYSDGAAYDPATRTWTALPAAPAPDGHPVDWTTAVATPDGVLAWSVWDASKPIGGGGVQISTGSDMFRYDPAANRWAAVPPAPNALGDVRQALWTGGAVVARGLTFYCGPRPCPYEPEATSFYRPDTNTWTALPPDPLDGTGQLSTWVAGQLLSVNGGGIFGSVQPGDASVYDPYRNRWTRLARAPFGCPADQAPTAVGRTILYYCPRPADGAGAGHDGLALTFSTK